jgi:hypothetical protein
MLDLATASKERHDQFVQRVLASREVWGLKSAAGWACTASTVDGTEDRTVMPFWSDHAYARQCANKAWADYEPTPIPLEMFLEHWLPGMAGDDLLVGTNWNAQRCGHEIEPLELKEELESRPASLSTRSKLDWYRTDPFSRFEKEPDPMDDPLLGLLMGTGMPDEEDRPAEIAQQKAAVADAESKGGPIGALKELGKLAFYEGRFQEALVHYLDFFEKSAETDYAGVRLSFFLSDFRGLVRAYDQAGIAYDRLITDRYQLLLAGRATALQAQEWFALMRYANFTADSLIEFTNVLRSARHEFQGDIDECLSGLDHAIECDEFSNSD